MSNMEISLGDLTTVEKEVTIWAASQGWFTRLDASDALGYSTFDVPYGRIPSGAVSKQLENLVSKGVLVKNTVNINQRGYPRVRYEYRLNLEAVIKT